MQKSILLGSIAVVLAALLGTSVLANRYTSPNYIIDASNVGASIAAITEGGSYRMVASGGESIVGQGQGGSYRLDQGYVAQLPHSLELLVSAPDVNIPVVIAGISQTGQVDLQVISTSPQYAIAIHQSGDLSGPGGTIPAVSASLASPGVWNEGTTKGLGMTVANMSFGSLPAKWSSGNAYAALPGTSSPLYSRTGIGVDGGSDTVTIRYRLDVTPDQESGDYTNNVTYTATWMP